MGFRVCDIAEGRALPMDLRAQAASAIWELDSGLGAEGVQALVTHDLHWLADIFAGWTDPATGRPARLPATANPDFWPLDSTPETAMIVLLKRDGRYIGASAMRLVRLRGTLRQAFESGAFFYGEKAATMRAAGWRAYCDIAQADQIADCPVIYNCAYRMMDQTAGQVPQRISWRALRLSQALACAHWHWSWMLARSGEAMAMHVAPKASGMTSMARGLYVYPPGRADAKGAPEPEPWQHLMFARRGDVERMLTQSLAYRRGESLQSPLPLLNGPSMEPAA